jgi:dienelactone hydrolase
MKRRSFYVPVLYSLLVLSPVLLAQERAESRRADRQLLLDILVPSRPPPSGRINATDKTWEDWLRRTGELPPDFDTLPSIAHLPDPLRSGEGDRSGSVTSAAQWSRQRQWIRSQVEHWLFGKMPPAPDNLRVASSRERRAGSITIRDVVIEFGPGHRARLNLQLMIPARTGPLPVFLTNQSPNRSPWVDTAVSRGYIACYYRATDPSYGDPDDSDAFIDIYPEYDFSCVARWAWAAARAVDYLFTLPEVAKDQIGITGHSRNGKQALLAAAFDERIGAVVASSGLQGEALPYRYTSDPLVVESIQMITGAQSHWFHPRLRFFAGREHKLPVDQNSLMALIAPRGLMMYASFAETNANAFALEQVYRSVRSVYRFVGREKNVWLHLREGEHPTETTDIENFMDFFDTVFGRRQFPKSETAIHGYDFERWQATTRIRIDPLKFPAAKPGDFLRPTAGQAIETAGDWAAAKAEVRRRIEWTLGEAPPVLPARLQRNFKDNAPPTRNALELVFGRPQGDAVWQQRLAQVGMGMAALSYGPGLKADLFYPVDGAGKRQAGRFPVVISLHPYAYAVGWSAKLPWVPNRAEYYLDQRHSFDTLVRRGFAVVAFDQIGFGSRAHEAKRFYERYPQWSLLGKMVADTRAVVEAVSALEEIDADRIFLLGYALGAKVGLFTAALDDRVRGAAAVCGLYPFRLDAPEKGTEGIRHYSHLHGLIPKLGFFLGHENRVPFDYDEVLALAAPKRVLVVAPELDRYAPVADVRQEVDAARRVYRLLGREDALELWTPRDFNRFPRKLQEQVFEFLAKAAR